MDLCLLSITEFSCVLFVDLQVRDCLLNITLLGSYQFKGDQ